MKKWAVVLTLFLTAWLPGNAPACSCVAPKPIQEDFERATAVFVAEVVDSERDKTTHVERARLVVSEHWKGKYETGDVVEIVTTLTSYCSKNVANDPVWLETIDRPGEAVAAPISNRWLIWQYGDEPLSIAVCSRSNPIELVTEDYEWLKATAGGNTGQR